MRRLMARWHTAGEAHMEGTLLVAQGDAWARRRLLIPSISRWHRGLDAQQDQAVLLATATSTARSGRLARGLAQMSREAKLRELHAPTNAELGQRARMACSVAAWRRLQAALQADDDDRAWWYDAHHLALARLRASRLPAHFHGWAIRAEELHTRARAGAMADGHFGRRAMHVALVVIKESAQQRETWHAVYAELLRHRGRLLLMRWHQSASSRADAADEWTSLRVAARGFERRRALQQWARAVRRQHAATERAVASSLRTRMRRVAVTAIRTWSQCAARRADRTAATANASAGAQLHAMAAAMVAWHRVAYDSLALAEAERAAARRRGLRALARWHDHRQRRRLDLEEMSAAAVQAWRLACARTLTAWMAACAWRERQRVLSKRGAAADRAIREATALNTWLVVATRRAELAAVADGAHAASCASRFGAAFALWSWLAATHRWLAWAERRLRAARLQRHAIACVAGWRRAASTHAIGRDGAILLERRSRLRGLQRLRENVYRIRHLESAVIKYWRRSAAAEGLLVSGLEAFIAHAATCHAADADATRIAVASDAHRLGRRALMQWMGPSRRCAQLRGTALAAALAGAKLRRNAHFTAWRRSCLLRRRCVEAWYHRERACASAHLTAWHKHAAASRRAHAFHTASVRAHARRHLHALHAYCSRRHAAREAGVALAERHTAAARADVFRGWRRQLAARSAARAVAMAWLESTCTACWLAWRGAVREAKRERADEMHTLARLRATLHAKPDAVSASASRCIIRWRLLLIGKVLSTWVAHARGRRLRRDAWSVFSSRRHARLLEMCVRGWREAMWHSQLMRRVRSDLTDEYDRDRRRSSISTPWQAPSPGTFGTPALDAVRRAESLAKLEERIAVVKARVSAMGPTGGEHRGIAFDDEDASSSDGEEDSSSAISELGDISIRVRTPRTGQAGGRQR